MLGDVADLPRVLVRLGLDDPPSLLGNAQRYLGNALVGVDHLLGGAPRPFALNRHKVLHRAGADNPVHGLDIFGQAVLNETEHLLRDLLSATNQDRAGLRHSQDVLRRTAGHLLGLRAGEAQHLRELVSDALEGLSGRVQARLHRVPGRLGAPVSNVRAGTSGLLANPSRFIGHGASCAGGLVGSLVLIVVVASSHFSPCSVTDKGSPSGTSGPGWPVSVRGEKAPFALHGIYAAMHKPQGAKKLLSWLTACKGLGSASKQGPSRLIGSLTRPRLSRAAARCPCLWLAQAQLTTA